MLSILSFFRKAYMMISISVTSTVVLSRKDLRNMAYLSSERLRTDRAVSKIALEANKLPFVPFNQRLHPAQWTQSALDNNECRFFIVYGPLGYGKSAYAMKCLAQLNNTWEPETLRKFIVWKPEMLIDVIDYVEGCGHDELMLVCDDAGVWLNAIRWNHPLLAALTEYFDVIRMHFHGLMFTSPLPMHVIKRIRGLPTCVNIRIDKVSSNPSKLRKATGYSQYLLPDMRKTRVNKEFVDYFSAVMPEKFYKWYFQTRKSYTTEAYSNVKSELQKWKGAK